MELPPPVLRKKTWSNTPGARAAVPGTDPHVGHDVVASRSVRTIGLPGWTDLICMVETPKLNESLTLTVRPTDTVT